MASDKKKIRSNALVNYFQASLEELRKVTWPTRNQAVRLTFLVLGFCMVVAVLLGVLDFVFGIGYRSLLNLGPERALPVNYEEEVPADAVVPTIDVGNIVIGDEISGETMVVDDTAEAPAE